MKNKKALSMSKLVMLILAILFFIMFLGLYLTPTLKNSSYENSIPQCNLFLQSSINKFSLFNDGLDTVTPKFLNSVAKLCPSKDVEVYDDDVSDAVDLIQDCWVKAASGDQILGKNVENQGVCIYCGAITGKEVENFDSKLIEELNKESNYNLKKQTSNLNLNSKTLYDNTNLPTEINSQDSAIVVYYTFKPQFDNSLKSNIQGFLESMLLESAPTLASDITATFSGTGINSFNGIMVKSWDLSSGDFKIKENPSLEINSSNENPLICDILIIPEKNYD